jgi:hypothetical protein
VPFFVEPVLAELDLSPMHSEDVGAVGCGLVRSIGACRYGLVLHAQAAGVVVGRRGPERVGGAVAEGEGAQAAP